MKTILPYGTWTSDMSAALVGGKSPQLGETRWHNGELYFALSLPEEKNRCTIMRYDGNTSHSLLPRPLNARSKVHEYGGGAFTLGGRQLFFVLADDQRIYSLDIDNNNCDPIALTEDSDGKLRFADLEYDAQHQRLYAVCEDHRDPTREPKTTLVAISLEKASLGERTVITAGQDFYAHPRISPDGTLLCWISWCHPNLPWDHTQLTICQFNEEGKPRQTLDVGEQESLCQPRWSPDGTLYVVSDRSNWWNIYRCDLSRDFKTVSLENICPQDREFATPPWTFNMSCYAFLNENTIIATAVSDGFWSLYRLEKKPLQKHTQTWTCTRLDIDAASISNLSAADDKAACIASSSLAPSRLSLIDEKGETHTLQFSDLKLEPKNISQATSHAFAIKNSGQGPRQAYGFYYPPTHKDFAAPKDTLPPTIVLCHGGPTGATDAALNLKIQYWTQRGFAVFDVNYRGSTGYGKAFRQSLYGQWGINDVDDLCAAADYLVARELADPNKLIIKGSSAGGYSVLAALAFRDTFKLGVSLYGIGDLCLLAEDTHKFEARYLDQLVGPYPEKKALYQQRSPLNAIDQFACPLLVFQGLEDKVVPPNQAEKIVEAVKQKGLPVAYRTFADEGHGFRNIDNIRCMLDDELFFYCKIFKLPLPADCQSNLSISNLEKY